MRRLRSNPAMSSPRISARWENSRCRSADPPSLRAKRSNPESKKTWIASSLTLLAMTRLFPLPEDRTAHADMRGAELDRDGEVGAHPHRQVLQVVARGDF